MILITGATGQLGSAIIHFLLQKLPASQIAGLVRDPAKAADLAASGVSVRVGDYDDRASLEAALVGIDKVLLVAGTEEGKRVQQHENVIDAAQRAGVQLVAYTSRTLKDRLTMANQLMEGHFQTEQYLKTSGIPTPVIFRNVLYMDAIPQFVGPTVFETGINLPTGTGRVPFALRRDLAEAIATVLADAAPVRPLYYLTGRQSYSFADVAAVLTELAGHPVGYNPADKTAFALQLQARGVPAQISQRIIGFMTDIANGQEDEIYPDLEDLLGRKPASLQEGLPGLFQKPA